jgi:hypothetical protein
MYALSMFKRDKFSQSSIDEFKATILEDTNSICGQIQQQEYQSLYVSHDVKNMKTIPIDEDKNEWK